MIQFLPAMALITRRTMAAEAERYRRRGMFRRNPQLYASDQMPARILL